MMEGVKIVLLWFCFVPVVRNAQVPFVVELNAPAEQNVWKFESADKKYLVAASVPGGIYSDLRRNGTLEKDLFWRFNDQEYRWVAKTPWSLSRTFSVPAETLNYAHQILVLHGIDTVADVYVNKKYVGHCDNMFIRYRFDVKGKLKPGENKIEIIFTSPVDAALERYTEQKRTYEVPPTCVPAVYNGECHVNHLRKMQASFSWDWGPAFPSVGAWKNVAIEVYNGTIIRDVIIATPKQGLVWSVNCTVFWETGFTSVTNDLDLTVEVKNKDGAVHKKTKEIKVQSAGGEGSSVTILPLPQDFVEVWWPNGEGDQVLYNISVSLADKQGREISLFERKIGFRTVELVQEPVDVSNLSKGLTFYLKVNSRPIFAKGSNWIPADILPERGDNKTVVSHLLNSAKDGNMNMLRVWGGGVYESNYFYELADELGIMIWQDMMFACAMYPTTPNFLKSVKTEVTQQYRRIQYHASVVIFAGNNENEAALRGNWYNTNSSFSNDTEKSFTKYKEDYVKLYVDTVRNAVLSLDASTVFIVSSPTNGIKSDKEGYVAYNPYDGRYGDVHTYIYYADGWNPNTYRVVRFSSEYGFQSLPSVLSYSEVTVPSDLSLESDFSKKRQHHFPGNFEMILESEFHLSVPKPYESAKNFPTIVYYTQINQAMSVKTETEALRRYRDVLTEDGLGLTMGALYWQLNDVWQAPSWASIEFNGRWKILHYFARKFFSPVLVSPVVENDALKVVIVSDLQENLQNAILKTTVYKWDSFTPAYSNTTTVHIKGAGTTIAQSFSLSELLNKSSCGQNGEATKNCVVVFEFSDERKIWKSDNFYFPESPKSANLRNSTIEVLSVNGPVKSTKRFKYEYSLEIKATFPSLFVWLETPISGYFSDNGFLMVSPSTYLKYYTDANVTTDQLKASLDVKAVNTNSA